MNNSTMMFFRISKYIVPILFLFAFSMLLPAQTEIDPALEEALQDAEFMQFLKRSGQSLDGLREPAQPKIVSENIVSNNTKDPKLASLEARNRLVLLGMLENLQSCHLPGFKKRQVEFGNRIDMTPGPTAQTNRELDVAIEGSGFFCVTSSDHAEDTQPHRFYTRYGSLERDTNGHLAVIFGANIYPLEPKITIPEDWDSLSINPQGEVWVTPTATGGTVAEKFKAGQIVLTRFSNPTRLQAENAVLFSVTPLSGKPISALPGGAKTGKIRQSALEQSNTCAEVVREEIKRLIDVSKILKRL